VENERSIEHRRPAWVAVVVWMICGILVLAVVSGMFLY